MDFGIIAGDTSKTIYVRLRDSTTGLAKTGLAYNTTGILLSYTLPLAARAAITPATQTVTGAWSSGGFVEVDATNCKGLYRLDLPDAAIASGAFTIISIQFPNVIEESIQLSLNVKKVNVTQWLGTAPATPGTAGVPSVDPILWKTQAIPTPNVTGVPKVDVTHLLGTAWLTPATAGTPDVNIKTITAGAIANASFNADVGSTAIATNVIGIAAEKGVVHALNVTTYAEPGQETPAATNTLVTKLGYLFKNWRNKKTQTATQWSLLNDDAATVDQKAAVADDGTTASKGEIATG